MWSVACFLALIGSICPANTAWDTFNGRCLLEIDGSRLIDGPCRIELFVADLEGRKTHPGLKTGTFSIETKEGASILYSAFVEVTGANRAAAWWSEKSGQTPGQHDPQGVLTRDGACWVGDRVRICAWK